MSQGWIGVDLDGTLAHYETWVGPLDIGAPVLPMVERVKRWLSEGREVRIFTARACEGRPEMIEAIERWCEEHIGRRLQVTNVKDYEMDELWDDRAVQVYPNTGLPVGGSRRGL